MNNKKEKDGLAKVGQSIAAKLNRWINPLPPAAKKKGLIVVGVLISMVCVMLVIQSFYSNEIAAGLKVEPITTPVDIHLEKTPTTEDHEQSIIEQYNRMVRFKERVEKLRSSGDQKDFDSLIRTYPGLRDSLNEYRKQYD